MNEQELESYLEAIKNKEMDGLHHLYLNTKSTLFGYALSILQNKADAEDVLHDTYIQVYKYINSYSSKDKPLAWLLTITKNLCYKKLKEKKEESFISLEDIEKTFIATSDVSYEDKQLLHYLLSKLSEEERNIVMLHSLSGYKHQEIADHLKKPISTILSKYNRAIAKLQEFVKGGYANEQH